MTILDQYDKGLVTALTADQVALLLGALIVARDKALAEADTVDTDIRHLLWDKEKALRTAKERQASINQLLGVAPKE